MKKLGVDLWLHFNIIMDMTLKTNQTPTALAVRAARDGQGLNMREFGEALGVTGEIVRQWEAGAKTPSGDRMLAWSRDRRVWVRALAMDLLHARMGAAVEQMLVPA